MNILVTGGASGLGAAITKLFATDTNNEVAFTYNSSADEALKIEKKFKNAFGIKCDFTNEQQVRALTDNMNKLDLDVIINNAYSGNIETTYFHKTEPENFLIDFEKNLLPVIKINQAAIKLFRKKKSGKIITILSSYLENVPPMGMSVYVANKAYLKQLTKVWASENAKFNITSNSVSPSFMKTGLTSNVDERIMEQLAVANPQKALLKTDEVAQVVVNMASATQHLNGVDIVINAGVNMR